MSLQRLLDILSLRTRGIRVLWTSDACVELSAVGDSRPMAIMTADEVSDFVAFLRGGR